MKIILPLEYRWFRAHGLRGLSPWCFLDKQDEIESLRNEYLIEVGRTKDVYPFARRYDMDDFAGFVVIDGVITDMVASVHLTWSSRREGYDGPPTRYYDSFLEWFTNNALIETKDWISEGQLEDYINEQV